MSFYDPSISRAGNSASDPLPSQAIAETLARAATHGPRAILVGNRAGIVEWANEAWTRITGFPLEDTIAKPITHFLEVAAIEVELVDFVGQSFLEGRRTTVVFPFETLDHRKLTIQLEVESLRDSLGEVDQFVATATDVSGRREESTDRSDTEPRPAPPEPALTASREPRASRSTLETRSRSEKVSLPREIERTAEPFVRLAGPCTHFDFRPAANGPSISANAALLREALHQLFLAATHSIDESWGFVSVTTGLTEIGRGFHSEVHPVIARPSRLGTAAHAFVEVHDTQSTFTPLEIAGIQEGTLRTNPRVRALATANALAEAMGGELYLDSTPGCGTQALLLLPC